VTVCEEAYVIQSLTTKLKYKSLPSCVLNYERTTRQIFVVRYDFLAHSQGLGMLGSTSNIYFRTSLVTMSADQVKAEKSV